MSVVVSERENNEGREGCKGGDVESAIVCGGGLADCLDAVVGRRCSVQH
jgi:hypothetical protein